MEPLRIPKDVSQIACLKAPTSAYGVLDRRLAVSVLEGANRYSVAVRPRRRDTQQERETLTRQY